MLVAVAPANGAKDGQIGIRNLRNDGTGDIIRAQKSLSAPIESCR